MRGCMFPGDVSFINAACCTAFICMAGLAAAEWYTRKVKHCDTRIAIIITTGYRLVCLFVKRRLCLTLRKIC